MPEPGTPENGQTLAEAVHQVEGLYLGDNIVAMTGQDSTTRGEFWQETQTNFPAHAEEIGALRKAIQTAQTGKEAYPEQILSIMRFHFHAVDDQISREFLADILFARTSTSPGYMDDGMNMAKEAETMARELGASGTSDDSIAQLELSSVVEAVLDGTLRVHHEQPQVEEPSNG